MKLAIEAVYSVLKVSLGKVHVDQKDGSNEPWNYVY